MASSEGTYPSTTTFDDLKQIYRNVYTELRTLVGPGVCYMCGVCHKLDFKHTGGVVTACMDHEVDPEVQWETLISQIKSARCALDQLRLGVTSSANLLSLMKDGARVAEDRDKIRDLLDKTTNEVKDLSAQIDSMNDDISNGNQQITT